MAAISSRGMERIQISREPLNNEERICREDIGGSPSIAPGAGGQEAAFVDLLIFCYE